MLNILRASQRLLRLAGHLLSGILTSRRLRHRHGADWHESPQGQAAVQQWMQKLTRILALRIDIPQKPLPVPSLIVANHVSWLDIIAIASVRPAQFLAKAEVQHWPLIGPLSARCGTRFIQRHRASAVHDCHQHLCRALRRRQHVAIFPEGTTSDGQQVGKFHPALFEAARQAYCPVQPLAIRYRQGNAHDGIAPYTGDDTFIAHLWRILARRETCVELRFLPPMSSRDQRRQLAEHSRTQIVSALQQQNRTRVPMPVLQPLPHALSSRLAPPLTREPARLQESA